MIIELSLETYMVGDAWLYLVSNIHYRAIAFALNVALVGVGWFIPITLIGEGLIDVGSYKLKVWYGLWLLCVLNLIYVYGLISL